jgi:hypothetical protein
MLIRRSQEPESRSQEVRGGARPRDWHGTEDVVGRKSRRADDNPK